MRVGIYGGTFDPVHVGHLILAEQAREQARLDEVWFIPAFRPPQKPEQTITRFDLRVEMLALALAGNPAFRINELEKERAGPSYTVDTLAELRRRHPGTSFALLLGGDALADLPSWRDPRGIVTDAALVVMVRPGVALLDAAQLRQRLALPADTPLELQVMETPLIDIASRDLRHRVAHGHSIRYCVPRAVEVYIHEKGLYRPATAAPA
jgi:nicotinate-nucleotide adenylyltransferase